ncbi:MAG: hypothetical protein GKR91_19105 [Pseudomonadales bacterium]|nr:hypothetical protein [Pseudomonadales bacterium]
MEVDEWLAPDSLLDLGNRELQVLYTSGHTEDSVSLLDLSTGNVFSGDFINPGFLYAFLPTSNMGDFLQGANTLLAPVYQSAEVFGAHRGRDPGIPRLTANDIADLRVALESIKNRTAEGSGNYPRVYNINENLNILAEPRWLQNCQPRSNE